jgi:O-antigen ligase
MQAMKIQQTSNEPIMSTFLLVSWAVLLSFCWLLPVTSPPWTTFPADAWSAAIMLLAAFAVVLRVRSQTRWHVISAWVAVLVFVPLVQQWFGLLPYVGQAWISTAYLLGFLIALLIGLSWESASPMQPANGLFLAIGIASFLSVGLQLYGWLALSDDGGLGVLFSGFDSRRPSGNLGQPNQLATLLLWGLLACLWAVVRGYLTATASILIAIFLLVGLALTQSRTGVMALTFLLASVWAWRRLWPHKNLPWVATSLYLLFLVLPFLLQILNEALLLGQDSSYFRLGEQSSLRLIAWRVLVQAALAQPIFGYGLTETTVAQIALADSSPTLGGLFSHAHNIVLDMVLWVGLPLGLFTVGLFSIWFLGKVRVAGRPETVVLLMLLAVVGIHAMLEFPHQYAYFLLPVGLVIGVLNADSRGRVAWSSPRWVLGGLCMAAALVLAITARDYGNAYPSYTLLRLEQGILGQGRPPLGGSPDVWVLTNLREWIRISRVKPKAGMSQSELGDMETIAKHYPSLSAAYKLSVALALNGRPDEARIWLARICKFTDEKECRLAQKTWESEAPNDPRTAAIAWPK